LHEIVKAFRRDLAHLLEPGQALDVNKPRAVKVALNPVERIERTIVRVRGHNAVLASDLAHFYGVQTRALNQAVRRNAERFPNDFAFRLTRAESIKLERSRSQTVILKRGRNIKYAPLAFTEHGAIMAASVLSSPRAVQMSIFVVRAFLQMREWIAGRTELAERLAVLERRVGAHDRDLHAIVSAIRRLVAPPVSAKRRIGFTR
jgi:hypothetical protein